MSAQATPVGGKLLTPTMKGLLILVGIAAVLLLWRFAAGLGAVTNLSDGYPWGLWIAFDVVTGTALGCGGYAIALLVYAFNKGKYHPLVRSALLASALGYTLGAIGVLIDVGRVWWTWKLPLFFWTWNLSSIQLEVALCIMLYTFVLWIELSPAFLEQWAKGPDSFLKRFAAAATPKIMRAMPWLIALGMLLPTMHQSSLGNMILLAGPKLHPLWYTTWIPFLFLVSCVGMGYGVTIMETMVSRTVYKRPGETRVLAGLGDAMVVVLLAYVLIRVGDTIWQGKLDYVLAFDVFSILFLLEVLLHLVPAFMLMNKAKRTDRTYLFRASLMIVFGGALYRFSAYWFAFQPGDHWSYFPAIPEILITVGLVAFEIAAYITIIKRFPILTGAPPATAKA
ncbi:MAG: Ni/Fe-hydrogenase cytochrome b subunit [Gemmatimonadota bacterium]